MGCLCSLYHKLYQIIGFYYFCDIYQKFDTVKIKVSFFWYIILYIIKIQRRYCTLFNRKRIFSLSLIFIKKFMLTLLTGFVVGYILFFGYATASLSQFSTALFECFQYVFLNINK